MPFSGVFNPSLRKTTISVCSLSKSFQVNNSLLFRWIHNFSSKEGLFSKGEEELWDVIASLYEFDHLGRPDSQLLWTETIQVDQVVSLYEFDHLSRPEYVAVPHWNPFYVFNQSMSCITLKPYLCFQPEYELCHTQTLPMFLTKQLWFHIFFKNSI